MAVATAPKVDVRELLKAGAHFGHKTAHWNPMMEPYIYGKRGGIYIIDLIQTAERLTNALRFLEKTAANGKQVLFVGTKRHIREVVRASAEAASSPYITERWLGGTLTNFETISGRVKHLKSLEEQDSSGELKENYNKREIGVIHEEIAKLNMTFLGIKEMKNLPGAVFVADALGDRTAVREAVRLGIPVVAIVDTNASPEGIEHVIPANDDAVSTISLISDLVSQAIQAGKAKQKAAPEEEEPKATTKKPAPAKSKNIKDAKDAN